MGLSLSYSVLLIIILSMSNQTGRELLTFFDSSLGVNLKDRDYAADCRLYAPDHPNGPYGNIWDTLDRYALAHFLGWLVKATMIRNASLCWSISLAWEILEVTLIPMLPNFAECWWDSWILDFALCNGLGIVAGIALSRKLEMIQYDWSKDQTGSPPVSPRTRSRAAAEAASANGEVGKKHGFVKNTIVNTMLPYSWTAVHWGAWTSPKRFVGAASIFWFTLGIDLSAFVLKTTLWIPRDNDLNLYRLCLWAIASTPAIREIYIYTVDPRVKRLGISAILCFVMFVLELCICIKYGRDTFAHVNFFGDFDPVLLAGWALLPTLTILYWSLFIYRYGFTTKSGSGFTPASPTSTRKVASKKFN